MNFRKEYIIRVVIIVIYISPSQSAFAGDYELRGQISTWGMGLRNLDRWEKNIGVRYIPEFTFEQYLNDENFIDAEISLNGFLSSDFKNSGNDLKLYRLKLRYATAQTETRIGLQKINFGPAQLLRSLRWFDRVDPRDPLKLTDGVYGLRFKYSFLNNTEFWLWSLYGNKKAKGYEVFATESRRPEFGGRVQFPIFDGEFATTFHSRQANATNFTYRENRFAFDGRWEYELGFWFESVFQHNSSALLPYEWNKMITLGTDYTFGIGNGVYVLAEHMTNIVSNSILSSSDDFQVTAYMVNYPFGIFDNVMLLGYYLWDDNKYHQFMQWQRIYDNFIISLSLFHYPQNSSTELSSNTNLAGAGYGAQIMLIFNH